MDKKKHIFIAAALYNIKQIFFTIIIFLQRFVCHSVSQNSSNENILILNKN